MNTGPHQHCVEPPKLIYMCPESNSENAGKSEIHVSVDTSSHASVLTPDNELLKISSSFNV